MFTGLLPVFDQGCERESAMMLPRFAAMSYRGKAAIASQQPAICSFPWFDTPPSCLLAHPRPFLAQ